MIRNKEYRLKKGSEYYFQTHNWKGPCREDDMFEHFIFNNKNIRTQKCDCGRCFKSISLIHLTSNGVIITDSSNLIEINKW